MSEKIDLGVELMLDRCPSKFYSSSVIVSGMLPMVIAYLVVAVVAGFLLSKAVPLPAVFIILGVLFLLMFFVMFSLLKGMCKRLSQCHIRVCENGIEGIVCLGQTNSTFCVGYDEISAVQTGENRILITVSYGALNLPVHEPEKLADLIREKAQL